MHTHSMFKSVLKGVCADPPPEGSGPLSNSTGGTNRSLGEGCLDHAVLGLLWSAGRGGVSVLQDKLLMALWEQPWEVLVGWWKARPRCRCSVRRVPRFVQAAGGHLSAVHGW